MACSTFLVIGFAATYPDHYDSGLYHAQTIRWIDEYPAVRGIANLHPRLAFNSSWHVLESFFGLSFLESGGVRALNALILVLTSSLGIFSLFAIARGEVRPSRLMSAAMFPLSIQYFQRQIASPLTDTPATLIAWLLWVGVLRHLERGLRPGLNRESVALLVTAFFLITVKLSAFPAVLIALVALGQPWKWLRSPAVALGASVSMILLPWVLRSVLLSGTLAFPVSWIGPLPVDWAVSREQISTEEAITRAWARIPMRDPSEVMTLAPGDWIPTWWSSLGSQFQGLLAFLILGPVVLALLLPLTRDVLRSVISFPTQYIALIVAGYLGAIFWFSSAPDIRFGFGTLVPLALALAIPIVLLVHRVAPLPARAGLVVILAIQPWGVLGESLEMIAQPERLLIPRSYYGAQTRLELGNGFPVLVSTGTDQCWNTPLPCTPVLSPNLILRGCTLDAGFRIAVTPNVERRADCAPFASVQGRSRVPEILPMPRIERVIMRRRNQTTGQDIDCDAERQNDILVLVRNRGAPSTESSLVFELDSAIVGREALNLSTGEERWVDPGSTPRPRRGDHVLQVRVLGPGDQTEDDRRIDVRCT